MSDFGGPSAPHAAPVGTRFALMLARAATSRLPAMSTAAPPKRSSPVTGAIVALAIAAALAGAFAWLWRVGTRPDEDTAAIEAAMLAPGADKADRLLTPTPEMLRLGKRIYGAQCAACHGNEGEGNGNGSLRLAVKPRDFRHQPLDEYRNGATPLAIYHTLTHGIGGIMPTFPFLDRTQKFAVAHYVRTFMPEAPTDPPEKVAEFRAKLNAPKGS